MRHFSRNGEKISQAQSWAPNDDRKLFQATLGPGSTLWNDKAIAAGDKLPAGLHTLKVVFTPEDSENFEGATGSVQLRIWLATHVFSKYEAGSEETFSHLALKHYGHATPYYWQWIIDANKGIIPKNYKRTRAGTKVYIPEGPPSPEVRVSN